MLPRSLTLHVRMRKAAAFVFMVRHSGAGMTHVMFLAVPHQLPPHSRDRPVIGYGRVATWHHAVMTSDQR